MKQFKEYEINKAKELRELLSEDGNKILSKYIKANKELSLYTILINLTDNETDFYITEKDNLIMRDIREDISRYEIEENIKRVDRKEKKSLTEKKETYDPIGIFKR